MVRNEITINAKRYYYQQKDQQIMANRYTEPKIVNNAKRAYVWFRFDGKVFLFTGGVNRKGVSASERAAELKGLAQAWKHSLAVDHYNPITKTCESPAGVGGITVRTLVDALKFAMEKKSPVVTTSTLANIETNVKYISEAISQLGMSGMLITDCRRAHFLQILFQVQKNRSLTAKGFNAYRSCLSSIVGELVQWEILDANPVLNIKTQPEPKTVAHKPPTQDERRVIVNKLKSEHVGLYHFCSVLYSMAIREKEILALQVRDIDLKTQIITIVPDRGRGNSKTLTERSIIIPDSLMPIFAEMQIDGLPGNYYIFGFKFKPGPRRMANATPRQGWARIVKTGLGIKKDLYGLKKLGGNDMIDIQKEALDLIKMPQQQMGHTTSTMTEVYVTRHKEIANDLLKKNMPGL